MSRRASCWSSGLDRPENRQAFATFHATLQALWMASSFPPRNRGSCMPNAHSGKRRRQSTFSSLHRKVSAAALRPRQLRSRSAFYQPLCRRCRYRQDERYRASGVKSALRGAVPAGKGGSRTGLRPDAGKDGLLLDEAETFDELLARCAKIQDKANANG